MEAAASVRAAVSTAVILRKFGNMTRLPQVLLEAPALGSCCPINKALIGKPEESAHPTAPLSRDMVNPRTVVNNIDRLCLPVWLLARELKKQPEASLVDHRGLRCVAIRDSLLGAPPMAL